MALTTHTPTLRVDLNEDATEAWLIIPAAFDRQRLTVDQCVPLLESAGVAVSETVRQAVHQAVNNARRAPAGAPFQAVVAAAQPPVHGTDGSVEWTVHQRPRVPEQENPDAEVNYYEHSELTFVTSGEVIGQIHPPTAGEPGRDVTGAPIEARDGQPVDLQLDESIQADAEGQLIAQFGGVFVQSGSKAAIHASLQLDGNVDFSTGHIDFDGNVLVKGDVRDHFRIHSTGDIEVHGLIEAATMEAQGDLHAKGGFAGREHGNVRIGGDLYARYLNNIHGSVQGSLIVEREIINCELTVHGNIDAERGAIIGGRLRATGAVHVALLGSRGGTPTEIAIGHVPHLEPLAQKLAKRLEQITARQTALTAQRQATDQSASGHPTSTKRHQQAVQGELDMLDKLRQKAEHALAHLRRALDQQRTVHIDIEKRLCPGVVFGIGHQRYRLYEELRGPIHIRCNTDGQAVYQRSGSATAPLTEITDVETA